jgi:hypothetical protein
MTKMGAWAGIAIDGNERPLWVDTVEEVGISPSISDFVK